MVLGVLDDAFKQILILSIEIMLRRTILVALLLLSWVQGLYFGISRRPFCFDIDQEPGKTIKFNYEVTGDNPSATHVIITPPISNGTLGRAIQLTGASNRTEVGGEGARVCLSTIDGGQKSVSVDFYPHDRAQLLELAKKSEIYQLHARLLDVGEELQEITKNELFEEQRQTIHAQIITSHENKVKNFAALKLIAIVAVAAAQLYLLKKMLDRQQHPYAPLPSHSLP